MSALAQFIVLLPLIFAPQPEPWSERGYGIGWQYPDVPTAALSGWHYNWAPVCPEPEHIPMAWDDDPERLRLLAACNGRPLLVGNEPEDCNGGQACMSPERMAALIHNLAQWWEGELWCGGVSVWAVDYAKQLQDVYRRQYGSWPCAGWHVHVYANGTLASPLEFASLNQPWRAEAALMQLDRFWEAMGRPRLVVTELGGLSGPWWHKPGDLVGLMRAFEAGIARRPHIESAAWFAAWDAQFSPSNLLTADGGLSVLGREWQR